MKTNSLPTDQWKDRQVLVTGAGGFIGSHLAEALCNAGARVRAMVHYNALLSHMDVYSGDICDRDSVRTAVRGMDTVFHLAALIAIPYSYRAPESYIRTNIQGTMNILQEARECSVRRVVHTSTSEVYGTARYTPIDEAHPLQGQSPYSASKIGADKMAEAFYFSFGVPVVTVRPFNTFGPRQSARAVIPTIITQCLRGEEVRLGSLAPLRDLNFVTNTVEGFILAGLSEKAVGCTINLGSGREISIGDLAELIGQLSEQPLRITSDNQRIRPERSEVGRLLACNALAKEILDWKPRVTLEDGLRQTIAWFRENTRRYNPENYAV